MIKAILIELLTGIKNKFGLYGDLPGKYQMAVLRLK